MRAVKHLWPIAGVLAVAVCGCSRASPRVDVSGRVTLGGRPVSGVQVTFLLEPGQTENGPSAVGVTDGEGCYRLMGADGRQGVVPGWHRITVREPARGMFGRPGKAFHKAESRRDPPEAVGLPKELRDAGSTPLRREVTLETHVIDLDL